MSKNYLSVLFIVICSYFGCSIHQQSPIKEVPYDFSDSEYYDKGYAPSPQYANDAGSPKQDGGESENKTKIEVKVIVEKTK